MFGMTGCTGAMWPVLLDAAVVRAADEGVPILALKRIFTVCGVGPDIRALCRAAMASGRLVSMPTEDWPALVPRAARYPMVRPHVLGEDDNELIIKMARAFKTTKLESRVLMVVLRRGQTSREMLHDAVEFNRGNPADETDIKIVDVVVCKLRKKLLPWGLLLHTVHSIGYDMTDAHREKAWAIIRGEETCH